MPTMFIATVFNDTAKHFVTQKHSHICTSNNVDLEKTERSLLNQSGNYVRYLDYSYTAMAHRNPKEGKWKGNDRIVCVVSYGHTNAEQILSNTSTYGANWCVRIGCQWSTERSPTAEIHGFVHSDERRELVSAHVPLRCHRYKSTGWIWKYCILSTQCIYVFRVILKINSKYCSKPPSHVIIIMQICFPGKQKLNNLYHFDGFCD